MLRLSNITSTGDAMAEWTKIASLDDIRDGQLLSIDIEEKKLLLTSFQGKIHASDRICTHEDADLSSGFMSSEGVRCPLHLSVFNLDDGKPLNPPATKPLKIYPVKIEGSEVFVEV